MRGFWGVLLGRLVDLWLATLRVSFVVDEDRAGSRPWVYAFFHGTQFALLTYARRRRTAVMVSHSKDGELQARVLARRGFGVVRGSSSRGAARALGAIVRRVRGGEDAAFAVDGPRGPYGVVKPGAALVARRTGGLVVPMGSAMNCGMVLHRAWDRFELPWPFSRVVVVVGPPVASGDASVIGLAIELANARAKAILGERTHRGSVRATPG